MIDYRTLKNNDELSINKGIINVFNKFYNSGFDVIASHFKMPNLHPWKNVNRNFLYQEGLSNLTQLRANSITLRLDNTDIYALDLDFNNELADLFIVNLATAKIFDIFYTTAGKRGCKIFFRIPEISPKDKYKTIPSVLSAPLEINGQKIVLECKRDLSCFFGRYTEPFTLYSEYISTKLSAQGVNIKFLALAQSINDLPCIDFTKFKRIQDIFKSTIKQYQALYNVEIKEIFEKSVSNQLQILCSCYVLFDRAKKINRINQLVQLLNLIGSESVNKEFYSFTQHQNSRLESLHNLDRNALEQSASFLDVYFSKIKKYLVEKCLRNNIAFNANYHDFNIFDLITLLENHEVNIYA